MSNLPSWTREDYYDESYKPFQWLYSIRENRMAFQQALSDMKTQARKLGVVGFANMWNAYVELMTPGPVDVTLRETDFPELPEDMHQLSSDKYECTAQGVKYTGAFGEEVHVISHPLMPVRRIVNLDTNEEKLELAYQRGFRGRWKRLIVSKETVASAQRIIGLSRNGIDVNSENAKEVVKYISAMESVNFDSLPSQNATSHMGWLKSGDFAPYCTDIIYDGNSPEFNKMFSEFSAKGKEDAWMEIALETRKGSSVPARIALAASFAAPLVEKMNALSFFVHLWGTQGCGKTVGLMLAASVWGNPVVGNYAKTFNGTLVSNEQYAAFCGNMPILLDELQIAADRKSFDNIIYMLCEGVSKGRGAKDGGMQLQQRWASSIITTGEMPIVQNNSGGGAAVRVIEVNYGGEPLFTDAVHVAGVLRENYGFAGRKFIAALQDEETMEALRQVKNQYYTRLSGDIQEKQVLSASLILAADKLADLTIFQDGRALTVEDIRPYLLTREQADANFRCYNWLMGYISGNPARFEPNDNNGELWGVIEDDVVYIIRSFFDRILQSNGFSPQAFLTWAKRNGKIDCDNYGKNSGNNRLTKRKRLNGHHVPCVAIVTDFNQPDTIDQQTGFVEVEDDDDMPF